MQTCKACQTGRLHKEYVPFVQILRGQMMIVPDVPAFVCDNCQHTIHDAEFMSQIDKLLDKCMADTNTKSFDEKERLMLREFLLLSQPNS